MSYRISAGRCPRLGTRGCLPAPPDDCSSDIRAWSLRSGSAGSFWSPFPHHQQGQVLNGREETCRPEPVKPLGSPEKDWQDQNAAADADVGKANKNSTTQSVCFDLSASNNHKGQLFFSWQRTCQEPVLLGTLMRQYSPANLVSPFRHLTAFIQTDMVQWYRLEANERQESS